MMLQYSSADQLRGKDPLNTRKKYAPYKRKRVTRSMRLPAAREPPIARDHNTLLTFILSMLYLNSEHINIYLEFDRAMNVEESQEIIST